MRTFLSLMILLIVAQTPLLGQSKKEVLKKAIAVYKENPYPPFKGYHLRVSPFEAHSTKSEYSFGFHPDNNIATKYYLTEIFNSKTSLDSTFTYSKNGKFRYKAPDSKTKKQLFEQNHFGALPSSLNVPNNSLAYFYIKKKNELMFDTIIQGEQCYRIEIKKKDTFDPVSGLPITNQKECITLSWVSGRIMEYLLYEEWDGEPYKDYYRFSYIDEVTWLSQINQLESEIDAYFVDYAPPIPVSREKSNLQVGDTIQYWHFKQLGGDSIDIRTLNRDYYVLDFWYTGCGPCVKGIPKNNALDSSIRQYNAQLLGITTFHQSDAFLENFVKKRNIKYTLFTNSDPTFLESNFPVHAYPTYILINKEGRIIHIQYAIILINYHQNIEDKIKEDVAK